MKRILLTITCGVMIFVAACSPPEPHQRSDVAEAWNPANDPSRFAVATGRFADLPREGHIPAAQTPWSDDYWATRRGGIAYRWQQEYPFVTGTYKDYIYAPLSRAAFQGDPQAVAALVEKLSPAEKYDLLLGRYDFPIVKREFDAQRASVDPTIHDVPSWFGICHGWAPATLLEPEPGAQVVLNNPDGVPVPFYTSDINALMSYVYAEYLPNVTVIGERCYSRGNAIELDPNGRVVMSRCRDSNPGSLHLVLARRLGGATPNGFIADISREMEVWNQAITGYRVVDAQVTPYLPASDPHAQYRAPGTAQLARLEVEISYITEWRQHREPVRHLAASYTRVQRFEYTLELDRDGTIIGGEWITDARPDFLWLPSQRPDENEHISYKKVSEILSASLGR